MIGKGKMTCFLVTSGTLRHPITLPLQIKRPWHPSGTRDVPQFGVGDVGHDADETRLASQTGNGREDHVNGTASHFGGPSGEKGGQVADSLEVAAAPTMAAQIVSLIANLRIRSSISIITLCVIC